MKFIVLTDTHFVPHGETLFGGDPRARLDAAVRNIRDEHGDAEFVLITGDLAHHGKVGAYHSLQESLAGLDLPVHLMMGNHDDRECLLKVIPSVMADANGFVQFTIETPELRLICLDTAVPGTSAGHLCRDRLDFLDRELGQSSNGTKVMLALHHPPFDVGIPSLDAIRLLDSRGLEEVLDAHRSPEFIFFGHVHRAVQGLWKGLPYRIQKGINHQVALDFSLSTEIPLSFESPEFSIVTLRENGHLVIHTCDFLYNGPLFTSRHKEHQSVFQSSPDSNMTSTP